MSEAISTKKATALTKEEATGIISRYLKDRNLPYIERVRKLLTRDGIDNKIAAISFANESKLTPEELESLKPQAIELVKEILYDTHLSPLTLAHATNVVTTIGLTIDDVKPFQQEVEQVVHEFLHDFKFFDPVPVLLASGQNPKVALEERAPIVGILARAILAFGLDPKAFEFFQSTVTPYVLFLADRRDEKNTANTAIAFGFTADSLAKALYEHKGRLEMKRECA